MDGQAGIEQNLNVIKAAPEGGVKIRQPVTFEGLGGQSPEVMAASRLEQLAVQGKNPHDVLREFGEEGEKNPHSSGALIGQFREHGRTGKLDEKNKSQPTEQKEEQNNEGQQPQQSGENQREQPQAEPVSDEEKKKEEGKDDESLRVTTDALSEYLFGIKPDSEENLRRILERLKEDKEIVRAKYGLPPEEMLRSDPSEYERRLREIAKRLGVTILPKIGCGSFFEENPLAGAVYLSGDSGGAAKIGVDIKRNEEMSDYIGSLRALEHEIIHALQAKRYPRMPIELLEYEAYVVGANLVYLEKDLEAIRDVFLGFFVGGSTNIDYRLMNQERASRGLPPVIPESLKKRR